MKYFISYDYEGLAGISNWQESIGSTRIQKSATEQINQFLKGIYHSDPDAEVVIADSHAKGENIIWEDLFGNTRLVRGFPRNYYMMQNMDSTFDLFVLFGYHTPIGEAGNMDHTYSASSIFNIKINDKIVDEAYINLLIASYLGVPLRFYYGDDLACKWIKNNISKNIPTLASKKVISRFAAEMFSQKEIHEKLNAAGKSLASNPGYMLSLCEKYEVEITMTDTSLGYVCQNIPGVSAVDARTIRYTAKDPMELYRYLMTIIMVANAAK